MAGDDKQERAINLYAYELIGIEDYDQMFAKLRADGKGYWEARLLIWRFEDFMKPKANIPAEHEAAMNASYQKTIDILYRYRTENY